MCIEPRKSASACKNLSELWSLTGAAGIWILRAQLDAMCFYFILTNNWFVRYANVAWTSLITASPLDSTVIRARRIKLSARHRSDGADRVSVFPELSCLECAGTADEASPARTIMSTEPEAIWSPLDKKAADPASCRCSRRWRSEPAAGMHSAVVDESTSMVGR